MSAARKLKRDLIRQALESKVVGGITPPDVAKPPAVPTKKLRLPITEEQMNLLLTAQAQVQTAVGNQESILRACLAQHHVVNGRVLEVLPGRPPKIVVEVADEPAPKRRKGG